MSDDAHDAPRVPAAKRAPGGPTSAPPLSDPDGIGEAVGDRVGRTIGFVFALFFGAVFALLWVYIVAAAVTEGALLADTWTWLSGLSPVEAVVVWLAILPIAVFVWAWQADLGSLAMSLVLLGMVVWTAIAFWAPMKNVVHRLRRGTT